MQYFYEILWGALGTIGSGIIVWLTVVITNWLNKKIKDKKLADILSATMSLILKVVEKTYQTTVETLKEEGKFTPAVAKRTKEQAIDEIIKMLSIEQKDYIASLGIDIKEWLGLQIESVIYQLKK